MWESFNPLKEEFSLFEVQQSAVQLNLPLVQKKLPLDDLQQLNSPAIFRTLDDKRIMVLANLDNEEAIAIDRGVTQVMSRAILAQRYDGEALVAQAALQSPAVASQVLCDDPVRVLSLTNTADEITQSVRISNNGKETLTLQIQRPIPGATHAELSTDIVAPGQTVTLHLKLKWRDILKGDTQNVFVFLKTSDPKRPWLQLGFQLKNTPPVHP